MKSSRSLAILVFVVALGSSYFAYGALGGAQGVRIPYHGVLENEGSLVSGEVDFTFKVFGASTGGSACSTFGPLTTTVTSGRFAVVIGPVAESCVKGVDVWIEVTVNDGSGEATMPTRQQIHPALGAVSSGAGDFHVGGTLVVPGTAQITTLSVPGNPWASGSVRAVNAGPGSPTATAGCAANEALVGFSCWDSIYWSQGCRPTASTNYGGAGFVGQNQHSVTCTEGCPAGAVNAKAICMPY